MKTVSTPQGDVKVLAPTLELLAAIKLFPPLAFARFAQPKDGLEFAVLLRGGEEELHGVKQQPVDCDKPQSQVTCQANRLLIAHALVGYLAHGFSGLFLPCAYIRTNEGGRFESGLAYFGRPSPQGRESREYPFDPAYDHDLGHGFTIMMESFIRALQQSSRDCRISLSPTIGLEPRSRSELGGVDFGFMLVGPHVVCLKTVISEKDPAWTMLRSVGIAEVVHLPMIDPKKRS